jgi:proline iminopeptidase
VVGSSATGRYADSEDSIYHENHPEFQNMQHLIERLKAKHLHPDERKLLSRQRTKLSLYDPDSYESYFSAGVFKKIATDRLNYFGEHEFPGFDFLEELEAVSTPTLIICGVNDVQCPIRCSEEMHERLRGSVLLRFKYSNHYPFLEEKERFQLAIRSFLD